MSRRRPPAPRAEETVPGVTSPLARHVVARTPPIGCEVTGLGETRFALTMWSPVSSMAPPVSPQLPRVGPIRLGPIDAVPIPRG